MARLRFALSSHHHSLTVSLCCFRHRCTFGPRHTPRLINAQRSIVAKQRLGRARTLTTMTSNRDDAGFRAVDVEDESDQGIRDVDVNGAGAGLDGEEAITEESDSSTPDELQTPPSFVMAARAYQLEMLEESMKRNIIVVMDTGTGKTQVAVLRIKEEIERSEKLVWFLAPTVELADQQFKIISSQIPEVQVKFITGASNVDAWKMKPGVWDAVLKNVRIVISTYQILFDAAVSHAFVKIESLGLVVIDEAHNCIGKNAMARFMTEGYARAKAQGRAVPHILGLTASPVVSSNLADLDALERTLDSIIKSPKRHRSELLARVNRPDMIAFPYANFAGPERGDDKTPTMRRLFEVFAGLDIKTDPRILRLRAFVRTKNGMEELRNAVMKYDTPCQNQMKAFCNRSKDICTSIGPWAADYYIHKVIAGLLQGSDEAKIPNDENAYLTSAVLQINCLPPPEVPTTLSRRTQALINILCSYEGKPVGIVFVKERATAAVLSHTLSCHPEISSRYRVGSIVGSNANQRSFLDVKQKKEDALSLEHFRKGRINLLIATSVLEEGIDVPVCNLVVCFEKPTNLKSFIQRRGRARMSASQLYLLVKDESDQSLQEWQALEREMKQRYEDEMRQIEALEIIEESETDGYPVLRDEDTGAQLTIHDAKSHLDHFCATLSSRKFVNWNPFYTIHDMEGNPIESHQSGYRKATVHLPVILAPDLRKAESLRGWPSEANACKDAAFQAYRQLYEAGLINQHLLPIKETDLVKDVAPRDGTVKVREQFNPWLLVADAWRSGAELSRRKVTISTQDGLVKAKFELVLPVSVPYIGTFPLYWDHLTHWVVDVEPDIDVGAKTGIDHTLILLAMAYGHRFDIHQEKQYLIRLASLDQDMSVDDIAALEVDTDSMGGDETTLIRHLDEKNQPYYYSSKWLSSKPPTSEVKRAFYHFEDAPEDARYLVVTPFPKKAGFFRRQEPPTIAPSVKPYTAVLPVSRTRVDNAPPWLTEIGMLVPAITKAVETHLVATHLLKSRLRTIGITDLSLVVTAITCSGARLTTDYERIEFLGDSILKFCTSIYLCAKHMYYTEGYLSASKDKIISNSRLYRAAIDFGLDRYIITKTLALHKWRPTYVEDLIQKPPELTSEREMSTKILADVVEALIGAAFITGGTPMAMECMSLFIPEVKWNSISANRETLYDAAPADEALPLTMEGLEDLIGYTFTKKSLLLEATTHPSYSAPGTRASFDRLEFLGDAILDYVVVNKLFYLSDPKPLENNELHLLRTALVNADILGFFVMEWCMEQESVDAEVEEAPATAGTYRSKKDSSVINLVKSKVRIPLSSFMRSSSPELSMHMHNSWQRHEEMREELLSALYEGKSYPWSLLLGQKTQKVQSDLFEALVGAVWVDSGSVEACEAFIERAGILKLMRRLLRDDVHLMHPKEELGHFLSGKPAEYKVYVSKASAEGAEQEFGCDILDNGICIASFQGGFSKEDARVRAAEKACAFKREEREKANKDKEKLDNLAATAMTVDGGGDE